MTALIETSSDRWTRMIRSTGVVGLVTFVVLFAAIIAMSLGEPAFTASPEEARAFYLNSTAGWVQAAMAVAGLAAIGWIWFVVGLCLLLGRAEGSPPWRSAVALVCGVILAALFTRVDPSPEFFPDVRHPITHATRDAGERARTRNMH
jgi:hypothetical protein